MAKLYFMLLLVFVELYLAHGYHEKKSEKRQHHQENHENKRENEGPWDESSTSIYTPIITTEVPDSDAPISGNAAPQVHENSIENTTSAVYYLEDTKTIPAPVENLTDYNSTPGNNHAEEKGIGKRHYKRFPVRKPVDFKTHTHEEKHKHDNKRSHHDKHGDYQKKHGHQDIKLKERHQDRKSEEKHHDQNKKE